MPGDADEPRLQLVAVLSRCEQVERPEVGGILGDAGVEPEECDGNLRARRPHRRHDLEGEPQRGVHRHRDRHRVGPRDVGRLERLYREVAAPQLVGAGEQPRRRGEAERLVPQLIGRHEQHTHRGSVPGLSGEPVTKVPSAGRRVNRSVVVPYRPHRCRCRSVSRAGQSRPAERPPPLLASRPWRT